MLSYNYVYKITNLINNKIYIGAHSTDDLNDGYMGSGKILLCAYKKYGLDNFNKTILKYFKTRNLMFAYERKLVNAKFVNSDRTYNLKTGGEGGGILNRVVSQETRLKISMAQKGKSKHKGFPDICRKVQMGKKQSLETISKRAKILTAEGNGAFNKPSHKRNPEVWGKIDELYILWLKHDKPGHGRFKSICISQGYPSQSYQKIVLVLKGKMKYIRT